jgi:hypothetical protein
LIGIGISTEGGRERERERERSCSIPCMWSTKLLPNMYKLISITTNFVLAKPRLPNSNCKKNGKFCLYRIEIAKKNGNFPLYQIEVGLTKQNTQGFKALISKENDKWDQLISFQYVLFQFFCPIV